MKQHEAVIEAMKANGGYATLGHLYQTAPKIPGCKWGTQTPFASIRRIVQTRPEFDKIKPGLWVLSSERERILKELGITESRQPSKTKDFNHSFYQGLVVEIGNWQNLETYVPNQDKNKPYLHRKLADVASLKEYYSFTYDFLLRRARTVDVTWFHERKIPLAFFEVEHAGDIQNSLLKFVEFQDFRIEFYIVADEVRHSEYNDKLAYNAFKPVWRKVQFLNYEKISDWHASLSASALLRKRDLL